MDRKGLISLLQGSAAGQYERTPFCPDDYDIAGFVGGTLGNGTLELVERHLPDCQACVSRVGLLTRLLREQEPQSQHETQLAVVSKDWKHVAPQWAAAASVVLAVGYLAGSSDFLSGTDQADYLTTRSLDSRIAAPEILAPSSGVIGDRDGFVWPATVVHPRRRRPAGDADRSRRWRHALCLRSGSRPGRRLAAEPGRLFRRHPGRRHRQPARHLTTTRMRAIRSR